jgi:hypothetical protein
LQPLLQVQERSPLASDPEACGVLAGNPEEPALPGYVEILQECTAPAHRRWFTYGTGDPRAVAAAAATLSAEFRLAFEPDDILLGER